jgi:peroxiredoxin
VVSGKIFSLKDFSAKRSLLVMFICQHCPYIQHIKAELAKLGKDFAGKDIAIAGISANDADHYPDDSPKELAKFAKAEGFTFPLLYDESQEVAKAYTAACTPDLFLFTSPNRHPRRRLAGDPSCRGPSSTEVSSTIRVRGTASP